MNKDSYRDKLVAFLDGELGALERSQLEAHLKKCSGCRKELKALKAALRLVAADSPPSFAGVRWTLPRTRVFHWKRWVLIPGLAAAALLAAILGGDALFKSLPVEKGDWVVVEGDSLSVDEGVNLALSLIRQDQELKTSLVNYDEVAPRDIYVELEDLTDEEEACLISLLEAKTEELERS